MIVDEMFRAIGFPFWFRVLAVSGRDLGALRAGLLLFIAAGNVVFVECKKGNLRVILMVSATAFLTQRIKRTRQATSVRAVACLQ